MMNNLFLIFDPSTSTYFNSNWMIMFMIIFFFNVSVFMLKSRINFMFFILNLQIIKDLLNNLMKKNMMFMNYLMSLMIMIMFLNMLSLFPFIFTSTSHISITLNLCLPVWFTMLIQNLFNSFNVMMSHMVPLSSPMVLSPFMVMIETISFLIRPLTMSIRLAANMIAGHLIMYLMSKNINISTISFMVMNMLLFFIIILETSVALIQAYVYVTLLSLYLNEM